MEEVDQAHYRDRLNLDCKIRFVWTREEGRMLVAGNHGFMPVETRQETGPAGTVVRRIPLVDADGRQTSQDYYAFWLRNRTNPLIEEFAEIPQGLFA